MIGVPCSDSRSRTRNRSPSIETTVTRWRSIGFDVGRASAEHALRRVRRVAARMHTQDVTASAVEPGQVRAARHRSHTSHASGAPVLRSPRRLNDPQVRADSLTGAAGAADAPADRSWGLPLRGRMRASPEIRSTSSTGSAGRKDRRRAAEAELAFYGRIFASRPAGELPPVRIHKAAHATPRPVNQPRIAPMVTR
jgi:hypothetical protein